MEISFENKTLGIFREVLRTSKTIQETAESVVPDVNDDIGRIASVQTAVFLKSKDITGRGVIVTGEAAATLLYITENEQTVSFLRLTKPFTMEFDGIEPGTEVQAQIKLRIQHTEARILNPRKVTVGFEIIGDLSCYAQDELISKAVLPEPAINGLHARYEDREICCVKAVLEKTFAVNEQFIFPAGKPVPDRILSHKAEFSISDTQIIGSKLIIKGNVDVYICYLSEAVQYPVRTQFNSPFSQIIDTGTENMDSSCACIELTSAYCDLIDTIGGDKAVDVELHALLEVIGSKREQISYISDAYSNLMPCHYNVNRNTISHYGEHEVIKLQADEHINVSDDCADVLSVFPALSQIVFQSDKITAAVTLDIIYRSSSGTMGAARRLVSLESSLGLSQTKLLGARLTDLYLRPDANSIDVHVAADFTCQSGNLVEISRVDAVTLEEESAWELSELATLTLVRVEKETLWELAKKYHSSIERISEFNILEEGIEGRLLLIPKSI